MVARKKLSAAKIEDLEVIRSIVDESHDWHNFLNEPRSTVDANIM